MKRVICLCLALCLALSAAAFAEGFDLENMNSTELNALKSAINSELERHHDPSSTQETGIEKAFKMWVEDYYGGSSNVSWPWFDYSYTREWDFFTITTRAEITKRDGGKASYNLYGELYLTDNLYTVIYVKVGNEVLLDVRERVITDPRVLKLLGFDVASEDTPVADEPAAGQTYDNETGSTASTAAQDAEPAVTPTPRPTEIPFTPIQRGDKGDEVKRIQQRLIDLNFLDGAADGSFGKGTEASVCAFQKAAGLPITGIVDKSTYDALFSSNAPVAKSYRELNYNEISRDPSQYNGKYYKFSGYVLQVMENSSFFSDTTTVTLRIATKGRYDNVVYVTYERANPNESRILEDDKVTVYAQCEGLYTYTAVLGNSITLPKFAAEVISVD